MTYNPAKPRHTLPFDGANYEIEATFALIEAIENALQESIVSISENIMSMPAHKIALLLATLITYSGKPMQAKDVSQIIFEKIGIATREYVILTIHVHAIIKISICSPANREGEARAMGSFSGS